MADDVDSPSTDRKGLTRRSMLQLGAIGVVVGASAVLPASAQAVPRRFIDIHHHFIPAVYRERLAERGVESIGRVPLPPWSIEQMLVEMDMLGISKAMLSLSAPGVFFGDGAFAIDLARRTNAALADLAAQHPNRIGGFATLPLPEIDASLAEWERAKAEGLSGVILLTNYGGKYLGHADFAPVLDELSRQGAVIFLHPTLPPGVDTFDLSLPPPVMEFVFDTTRTLADMIFTGALDRYSGASWITAHLAGALPFVAGRLSLIEQSPRDAYAAFRERGRTVQSYLEQLYFDTAVSATPASLAAILRIVGPDRLVFGSDRPFLPMAVAVGMGEALIANDALSPTDIEAIGYRNAERILPG